MSGARQVDGADQPILERRHAFLDEPRYLSILRPAAERPARADDGRNREHHGGDGNDGERPGRTMRPEGQQQRGAKDDCHRHRAGCRRAQRPQCGPTTPNGMYQFTDRLFVRHVN